MKKIINVITLGFILTGFSSCLKSTNPIGPDSAGAIKNVVEFQNISTIESPTSSTFPLYVQSFDVSPTGTATLMVNYAGADVAPQDISVKVALDNTAITKYNTENDESYIPMPSSLYSLSPLDLVIPKGKRTASITINVKPDMFDFTEAYALAFKITSASTGIISGNFGTVVLAIGAKNRIDGLYSYTTSATTSLQPSLNHTDVPLTTTGATTVKGNLLDTYSNIVGYSVDPVTNKVTVTNSGLAAAAVTDPSSNYDPVKKILRIKWTAGSRSFDETYTYTGSR